MRIKDRNGPIVASAAQVGAAVARMSTRQISRMERAEIVEVLGDVVRFEIKTGRGARVIREHLGPRRAGSRAK
jgi:hypothetical protein